jgi:ribonucleoside-diphosphate reductase alpha chain
MAASSSVHKTIHHPVVDSSVVDLSGIQFDGTLDSAILDLRPRIERGKEYSFLAATLLCEKLRQESLKTLGHSNAQALNLGPECDKPRASLTEYVNFGVALGHLSPRLKELDLEALDKQLDPNRNYLFDYLGAHTLYDRYLLHKEGERYEDLQHFWMRVAMGISLAEADEKVATERAAEFYHTISRLLYVPSTPTLFNSGTARSQMSSCFLTTTQDDLVDIYRQYADNALLSKFAGGLGNDWTNIRASGSWIKGTNGRSQGVIPFIKVQDSSTIAVNQGGKRKGAVCAYLETWHLDIEDFLELRKNTGDERRRTHDMNTANWVPDLFLERVEADGDWTLFCPSETPELHDIFGAAFKTRYEQYERDAAQGKIKNFKTMKAVTLWRKMLTMLFETGHPWVTFKDPCNLRSPQSHAGVVHSSNLCTEITLNTSADETAVCNLGSLNLKAIFHTKNPYETLRQTVTTAMRMLDNVITENFYPIESAKNANTRHRPVGLGLMGFQDLLYMKRMPYSSAGAVYLADKVMEAISYHAIATSAELAQERGSYSSFEGSTWSKGEVPLDSLEKMGSHVKLPELPSVCTVAGKSIQSETLLMTDGFPTHFQWDDLRRRVKAGMRNSLCMAIAPTATISNIAGCNQSIEPAYKNLYVKSNLGGEYTMVNEFLVNDLRAVGKWTPEFVRELKIADGSVAELDVPAELKELYQTAFDVEPEQLIRCAAMRQKYIDQAQSLNLYLGMPSGRRLDEMYRYAWHSGLKTTYYLRSRAATSVEKSSVRVQKNPSAAPAAQACSIENPDCEACQ